VTGHAYKAVELAQNTRSESDIASDEEETENNTTNHAVFLRGKLAKHIYIHIYMSNHKPSLVDRADGGPWGPWRPGGRRRRAYGGGRPAAGGRQRTGELPNGRMDNLRNTACNTVPRLRNPIIFLNSKPSFPVPRPRDTL